MTPRRPPQLADSGFREALLRDIRRDARAPAAPAKRAAKRGADVHALELCLFDLHIGKYAWGEESGEDYDTEVAERRARAATLDLLGQARNVQLDCIILPIGNDLLHYDNMEGTTTAGTAQDRDTRFQRMFRRARALMAWMIRECARHAPVRVVIVPGNHDTLAAFTLGEVLAAEFARDPRVTFENSPRKRKYVAYGRNLIVYAHGHAEPHRKLPEIVAAEEPRLWAAATTREVHLGHFHRSKVTEPVYVEDLPGCTVRVLRSLSGTDAWHSSMGFVGNMCGAEAFLWRKRGGLRANFFHQVAAQ